MARPRRNTATAVAKADTAETVQAVKKESAVCAAEEKGTVSAAAQKDAACVSEKKGTAGAAEALRLEGTTGRVAPGLSADLALFDADPTQDMSALDTLRMTFQGGILRYLKEETI